MRRTASVERASRRGKRARSPATYVMCVNNESNPESLDLRKIYRAMPDAEGAKHGYIRVVDESGEGYLYPKRYFIPVALPRSLPRTVRKVLA